MKYQADKRRKDVQFEVGDWVFLKLRPHRQNSVVQRIHQKLAPRFFGPYQIMKKIGQVTYKLKLPPTSKIHLTFHVSQLKKAEGNYTTTTTTQLPISLESKKGDITPAKVLSWRDKFDGGQHKREWLIQWEGMDVGDATWEEELLLKSQFSDLRLEDKANVVEEVESSEPERSAAAVGAAASVSAAVDVHAVSCTAMAMMQQQMMMYPQHYMSTSCCLAYRYTILTHPNRNYIIKNHQKLNSSATAMFEISSISIKERILDSQVKIVEDEITVEHHGSVNAASVSDEGPASLSKMVALFCEQQLLPPLLRAFDMFLPSCPLLPFIRALQAFSQMRLSEASAHLGSFSARIKEEPMHIANNSYIEGSQIIDESENHMVGGFLLQEIHTFENVFVEPLIPQNEIYLESSFKNVSREPNFVNLDPTFKLNPPAATPPVSYTHTVVDPLDADPSSAPYDPKTNYLSLRP
ncbi:hypothetical protein KIW84_052376 [Lathyrus oleraceus]|uniref:Chromo domain-containing protein n=1 Tax=Pisum sativum TaxID=3888 RepID=A0A9D4WRJ2_PEA|nr:hypothetical protein KIW84_052376 [Pisum sativum]